MKKASLSIVVIIIISILISIFYFHHQKNNNSQTASQATPVKLSQCRIIKIPNIATAVGNLAANQSTSISSKVNGYIIHIYYNEGDYVNAGTPLIQLDNRSDIDALNSAKAAAHLSEAEYKRNQMLLKKGFITEDVYYSSKTTNEQNQATLLTDEDLLADKTITAPFSGIIGAKKNSVGDYVTAGNSLTSLVDITQLRVEYSMPSKYQAHLQSNQPVIIESDNLPNQKFLGKVTYVAPTIDADTQTIALHATIENPKNILKAGQFVHITQQLSIPKAILVVPTQAVISSLNGYYVYTIKNNHAVKTFVSVGSKAMDYVAITHGLTPGTAVVIAGQDRLDDGSLVRVIN